MEGDLAAYTSAGFADAADTLGGAIGSGSDSDYDDVLGGRTLQLLDVGPGVAGLAPGADLKLVRLQSEHALSMMELRHEKEASALRQDVRRLERHHRGEARRREKAIAALSWQGDELANKLSTASAELAQVTERYVAAKRADTRHRDQLTALRAQAAADASTADATITALRQRLDEEMVRGAASERTIAELRKDLEGANLASQDLQRSVNEGREALQRAWRDASSATAARDLLSERVSMHQREAERLEEAKRLAEEAAHARTEELREACAALAAAREQRNQAAREAEACRAVAEEAKDDLEAGHELAAASEARVGAAERKTAQEAMMRERAEASLEAAAVQQAVARTARQRRMLVLLLRVTRTQRAIGFARWVAGVAAVDARSAAEAARCAAANAIVASTELQGVQRTLTDRDAARQRMTRLGTAWLRLANWAFVRLSAAEALGRWASCARVQLHVEARWERLVRRASAELDSPPRWRMLLAIRTARVRGYPPDEQARRCRRAYDTRRTCLTIFALWRLWAQGSVARAQCAVAEARYAPLHVSPAPWYS